MAYMNNICHEMFVDELREMCLTYRVEIRSTMDGLIGLYDIDDEELMFVTTEFIKNETIQDYTDGLSGNGQGGSKV